MLPKRVFFGPSWRQLSPPQRVGVLRRPQVRISTARRAPRPSRRRAPPRQPHPAQLPNPTPAAVATGTAVKVGMTRLGDVLVDARGRTLYLFLADHGTTSSCKQLGMRSVLAAGPQQGRTPGQPRRKCRAAGHHPPHGWDDRGHLRGPPLYYFISDKKAGDVTGQGIDAFGGLWYVVSPSRMLIR
jgi:predicted lipoprotein with Yx(FWY)xxD motif